MGWSSKCLNSFCDFAYQKTKNVSKSLHIFFSGILGELISIKVGGPAIKRYKTGLIRCLKQVWIAKFLVRSSFVTGDMMTCRWKQSNQFRWLQHINRNQHSTAPPSARREIFQPSKPYFITLVGDITTDNYRGQSLLGGLHHRWFQSEEWLFCGF